MKRLRVDEPAKENVGGGGGGGAIYRQSLSNPSPLSYTTSSSIKVIGGDMQQSTIYPPTPPVNYATIPPPAQIPQQQTGTSPQQANQLQSQSPGGSNFHRLKVEDALSYLDLVKYKFNNKPQVYNDFLDIMKEFKSQSIDTPGVIQRVSNLFKGFPDLIVGFNTFLPPGYKIEVQQNNEGYAFQVSVSVPSPTGGSMTTENHHKSSMIMKGSGVINTSSGGVGGQAAVPSVPIPAQSIQNLQIVSSSAASQNSVAAAQLVQHHGSFGNSTPSHNTLTLSAAQAAVSQALQGGGAHVETPQNQPVEFNHAINYVNKIKNRFQGQPEKYKRFLEILHTYQKEQRSLKETATGGIVPGIGKQLTEQEVYAQVAKLFENQSDLLAEFGQFLPDATSHINQASTVTEHASVVKKQHQALVSSKQAVITERHHHLTHKPTSQHHQVVPTGQAKRASDSYPTAPSQHHHHSSTTQPAPKRHKISSATSCRDVTLAEAGKYGTLNDYAFFDKVRKAVKTHEAYTSFLRCLNLFNQEIVSKSELVQIITPFLSKYPELMKWFRDFLGQTTTTANNNNNNDNSNNAVAAIEPISFGVAAHNDHRAKGELLASEIDLATAKRLGASYCIIPSSQERLQCSGRTQLCREVLNDQWVSFPTWSEDSTFVSSRKTQYEEYMYRCEDERFELDVVIETNASTIRVLEGVNKKLGRMSSDEVARYRLDDTLGGTSTTLHQRALRRIYGDKAPDIIDGLKRNPGIAVPVVLRRLKIKEEEWREAQKGFNKIWRDQNEKYYLKSLDHQGINFKQTDVKALRSKSLFNEIETIFDERHEQNEEGVEQFTGPHLIIFYKDRTILDDAANLLIHNVKRQTSIQKSEKRKIKQLVLQFLPDLFFHPRQHLSEDEREDDDRDEDSPSSSPKTEIKDAEKSPESHDIKRDTEMKDDEDSKVPQHAQTTDPEEAYTLFFANNNWYIFLRLHAILCERLAKIYERAVVLAEEEARQQPKRKESTAIALRLKPKPQIEVQDYYPAFLDMVKNLLDGNMDANSYEDTLREMFGIHAYVAFTLDKVVSNAVRQLQHCATERSALACYELHTHWKKRGGAGGPCANAAKRAHLEAAYQKAAEKAVQDENCFKICIYKKEGRMTIELLDTEGTEDGVSKKLDEAKSWSNYKDRFANCANIGENKMKSPIFLERNLRLYKKRAALINARKTIKIEAVAENSDEAQQQRRSDTEERSSSPNSKNDTTNSTDQPTINDVEIERKFATIPERNRTEHQGYDFKDDTECRFRLEDSKIVFTNNKDSYIYKIGALDRARKSHPRITKRLSSRFKAWSKRWTSSNVSEIQHKQCTDWLMGRGEGIAPNRTRIVTENNSSRTPYAPFNRYRVERITSEDINVPATST